MLRHYLKVNLLIFFGSLFLVVIFAYLKAPSQPGDDTFYRAILLAIIYLSMTQLIFSLLSASYFFIRASILSKNQKVWIIIMPHLIYLFVLFFKYNELVLIQSFVNILACIYTYTQFIKANI